MFTFTVEEVSRKVFFAIADDGKGHRFRVLMASGTARFHLKAEKPGYRDRWVTQNHPQIEEIEKANAEALKLGMAAVDKNRDYSRWESEAI